MSSIELVGTSELQGSQKRHDRRNSFGMDHFDVNPNYINDAQAQRKPQERPGSGGEEPIGGLKWMLSSRSYRRAK